MLRLLCKFTLMTGVIVFPLLGHGFKLNSNEAFRLLEPEESHRLSYELVDETNLVELLNLFLENSSDEALEHLKHFYINSKASEKEIQETLRSDVDATFKYRSTVLQMEGSEDLDLSGFLHLGYAVRNKATREIVGYFSMKSQWILKNFDKGISCGLFVGRHFSKQNFGIEIANYVLQQWEILAFKEPIFLSVGDENTFSQKMVDTLPGFIKLGHDSKGSNIYVRPKTDDQVEFIDILFLQQCQDDSKYDYLTGMSELWEKG